jgi:thiol-disulfide isomerase/thioredoxin
MPSATLKSIAFACLASASLSFGAAAFEEKPFDMAAFKAAQGAGKPILVDAFAAWCPVCRSQHKVLDSLKTEPAYESLTLFRIDYDNQTDALRALDVRKQSTLIAFKGDKETGRSVGDTKEASIKSLLDSAVR